MDLPEPAVFHAGETAVQERLGVAEKIATVGSRVIRDHMPDQHREFFAQLPFVITGTVDPAGQPWASLLAGPPGFISSPDPRHLVVTAVPPDVDPLSGLLTPGAALGLLGIEPHTRRRNRMNGTIESAGERGIEVRVSQSFGNCPKYIQARTPEWVDRTPTVAEMHRSDRLDEQAQRLIRAADTFFIASAHPLASDRRGGPAQGIDVSHRGGKPGFVRVDDEETLTVPDFIGNFLFNTLGNLTLNPRAGLLFLDFDCGERLHVAVTTGIIWDGPEVRSFEGAQRLLRFGVHEVRRVTGVPSLRWGAAEISPYLDATGDWP